ncbi:putative UDP-N-acetylglucosamine-peptide N-acetylglucosaminyltransferase SPINDLY-like protein [Trifolium pratense]|uniref:Putative UDP-N-acetylglucosamine-peptide N-acetylglucosaminyltransferase SPINDLY-like protein n=1 Tax=Trifolium pratense TaxID=57577 RepID=A0A2K3PG60_TRIPR|nr:putative UDP-N-acetylglucosamine-peptide N-acetylglucosaminyltransferase SPINDLY-like protein [Trifolium pratense]
MIQTNMIEKAIIANLTYAEPYNNLGVLYKDNGDIALAINAYEQCFKIDADSRNAGQVCCTEADKIMKPAFGYLFEMIWSVGSFSENLFLRWFINCVDDP